MQQQEAEVEATRRNLEDARRERFVFYALDHSAGLAADAWDVAMRLRHATEVDQAPPPLDVAAGAELPVPERAATFGAGLSAPEPDWAPAADPLAQPAHTAIADHTREPVAPSEPPSWDAAPGDAREPVAEPRRRGERSFGLLRAWGAFVVLVGVAFIAAVLVLAVALQDYTHLSALPVAIAIAAGLLAIWVGVQLARPRH